MIQADQRFLNLCQYYSLADQAVRHNPAECQNYSLVDQVARHSQADGHFLERLPALGLLGFLLPVVFL